MGGTVATMNDPKGIAPMSQRLTDSATLEAIGQRIARHRLDQNLTQAQLSEEAGVSKRTLVRLESGESTQVTNLLRVLRALGLLNLDSIVPAPLPSTPLPSPPLPGAPVPSPIAQLRPQQPSRKRASPSPRKLPGRPR